MSCGKIKLNCTVTEFKTERNKTRVEDYGSKKIKFEEGIMEINAYDANPNMEIPILSEEQMHHIEDNLQRRVTESAMRVKRMRKSNDIESR